MDSKIKFKELYLPIKENGELVKFKKSKDGFIIPLSYLDDNKKNQHLTIYFKHFKEIKNENPEELFYLNLHIKDENIKKKLFEEEFYFNLTKIQNIFEYNLKEFLLIFKEFLIPENNIKNNIYDIDEYLENNFNINKNLKLFKKKETAKDFLFSFGNKELKKIKELKKYPYLKFNKNLIYYEFENDIIYKKMKVEDEIFFINIGDFEKIQKEVFDFLFNLFPKFKNKFSNFVNVVDIIFPNLLDIENLNEIFKK